MIPEAYNHKRENSVNICKSCDWLSTAFRLALLEGNFDKAVALCATSNVNLNTPFANVKGELFYPVHCAVIGGNLDLLQWLVDEHCCPIKSVRVSGKTRNGSATYTPIVTSKGRSLLGIAMEHANVPVIRYLVVKKGISLAGEKDITPAMLITNLEAVLRLLPEDGAVSAAASANNSGRMSSTIFEHASAPSEEEFFDMPTPGARSLSEEARDFGAIQQDDSDHRDECKYRTLALLRNSCSCLNPLVQALSVATAKSTALPPLAGTRSCAWFVPRAPRDAPCALRNAPTFASIGRRERKRYILGNQNRYSFLSWRDVCRVILFPLLFEMQKHVAWPVF